MESGDHPLRFARLSNGRMDPAQDEESLQERMEKWTEEGKRHLKEP